jgi:predicted ATPase
MATGVHDLSIEQFRIHNFRVLKDVTFSKISRLTVLCGPNGSGKSTVFDAFAFLHTAFTTSLRRAWDERNRMSEIRSRGAEGPIGFEIKYRTGLDGRSRLATYTLEIDEEGGGPIVTTERLQWTTAPGQGRPRTILGFADGQGQVYDEESGETTSERLVHRDQLAVSALGALSRHPRVTALRDFISGWYLSYLNVSNLRATPIAGPAPRLSQSGDNLANVLQFLEEQHPQRLEKIFAVLASRVPRLEKVLTERLPDGRLLLRLKDEPFDQPVLSRFTSDGTLKLLAYLTVLHDPDPPAVVGIEEPENQLHPALLPVLAEEAREASAASQLLVTTHSPEFVDALHPLELWAISRGDDGFAKVMRASDMPVVVEMVKAGATLGDLWRERYLGENPLSPALGRVG